MCGEQLTSSNPSTSFMGSSPRVRGAAGDAHRRVVPLGIIPACAGSRTFLLEALGQLGDHPRVCGEQMVR